ncbi:SET domain-containing protein [Parahaliea mediterranea]|uniref:SET domain-containing protein n=1 Tax=Parahaliea mediterranea TaxID=651086 RepID=UPI000E2F2C28|nr:SET domain-containing protein [Parahaliea mediterranea]
MTMKRQLRVGDSGIHGKGLFAAVDIKAGTLLGVCQSRPTREPTPYTLWLDEDTLVDVTCRLRFINHNKSPNVIYYDDLSVVSLRDIKAGEELTHDYGEAWAE